MQLFVNRSFISLAFLLGLSTASHVLDGTRGGESANVTLPKGLHVPFLEVHLPALVHLSAQGKGPAILAVSGTSGTTGAPVAQSQSGSSAAAEDASTEASIAAKYKIAGCDRYGVTYCSTNCVQCDSSGRVQKKPNCANFQYCQECYDYCYCVTA